MIPVCLITATYIKDIDRFKLLRQSINKYAHNYHHITVVHDEDIKEFKKQFPNEKNFTLLSTADILPKDVERRREKLYDRKIPLDLKRRIYHPYISGWHCQQLTKIATLAACDYEAAAFLDSDLFLCQPLDDAFFGVKGNIKIFRRRATNAEQIDYYISTYDLLNCKLNDENLFFDYIFAPACFRKETAKKLMQYTKNLSDKNWLKLFSAEKRPSEYNLLGHIADNTENFSEYSLIELNPDDLHYSIRYHSDLSNLKERVHEARTNPIKPFCLVQSNLDIDTSLYL